MDLEQQDSWTGKTVGGRYRLEQKLGEGGMGVVYAATHLLSRRPVAVKVLQGRHVRDPHVRRRFVREARATCRIEHPNVVQVVDVCMRDDGPAFVVMERLDGPSLADAIEREGALDLSKAAVLLFPVMDAVTFAHRAGVLHRDIKPANIVLAKSVARGRVAKLVDFGLAKVLLDSMGPFTDEGEGLGTIGYSAPEQIEDSSTVGPTADVWAMGAVWYEALTGHRAFPGKSAWTVLTNVLAGAHVPMRSVSEVPQGVCAVIERALERRPEHRYASMADFRSALERAIWDVRRARPSARASHADALADTIPDQRAPTVSPRPTRARSAPLWFAVVMGALVGAGSVLALRGTVGAEPNARSVPTASLGQ